MLAILLAGCGLERWQAYPGEARPGGEVARLRPEPSPLRLGLRPVLTRFDGVPMQVPRAFTKRYDIELLPGRHELELKVEGNDGTATVVESRTMTLWFEAQPGAAYELRVAPARSGVKAELLKAFVDAFGAGMYDARWLGWIEDRGTGATVSRVKPWPRADDAATAAP